MMGDDSLGREAILHVNMLHFGIVQNANAKLFRGAIQRIDQRLAATQEKGIGA